MRLGNYQIGIIGGGIVGLATGLALARSGLRVGVIESEKDLALHQTGHNSGVIHSGIYYKPGSAKARTCTLGREELYRFCAEHGLAYERCGKVIVATDPRELPALEMIEQRGKANGLHTRRLDHSSLKEYEPHVSGIAGIFVRETGIVDYPAVARKYAELIQQLEGEVHTSAQFLGVKRENNGLILETTKGEVQAQGLVNCAGLYSDRVARLCGLDPEVQIVPFRGEYYQLRPEKSYLVRNLIYPVPNPQLPFLGVHFTRMIRGGIEAGPNAVLAFRREGYRFRDVSLRDLSEMALFPGFWKMVGQFWRTGIEEFQRSLFPRFFWKALTRLIPDVQQRDIVRIGAGVRAQAINREGKLVDDFYIRSTERMIHVLNAPSPAATASLTIGQEIAQRVRREMSL